MSKKELIVQKALELFSEEGYEGTGVQRIVDAAEVTKPTLYHFFGSKEGLLVSIFETHFGKLTEGIAKLLPYNGDIQKTIEDLNRVYIGTALKDSLFFWLAFHLRRSPKKSPVHRTVGRFYEEERSAIHALMASVSGYHTNLMGKEDFLTLFYLSLIDGFIEMHEEKNTLESVTDNDVHLLSKEFLYGIFSL